MVRCQKGVKSTVVSSPPNEWPKARSHYSQSLSVPYKCIIPPIYSNIRTTVMVKPAADGQHWLFQLANTFLFLSYASRDLLMLRIVLMLAGFCFVMWGSLVLSKVAIDTVIWNAIFCLINAVRASELAWQRRPIKFDREEHEIVYAQVFEPVGISRLNFKLLIANSLLRTLRAGSTFIEAGNEATNLTLIIRYDGHPLGTQGWSAERTSGIGQQDAVCGITAMG